MPAADSYASPLFLAHGAPSLAIADIPAHHFLKGLGRNLQTPEGVIILSAHWETDGLKISAPGNLRTIHDFRGFDPALQKITYPASASQTLVRTVIDQLQSLGTDVSEDGTWGLDHGAWVPLSLLFPEPSFPIVQLSLPFGSTPESVYALGRQLAPLAEQNILILGSGSTTHNLSEARPEGSPAPDWVTSFDAWVDEGLEQGDIGWFSDLGSAPGFRRAHPTDEHFLPLFFAMGAGSKTDAPELLHRSYSHGSLSMSYFRFH